MNKLLIICGATATGKTSLALSLAKMFNGELISADSRQVYQGLDIGTGKDLPSNSKFKVQNSKFKIIGEDYLYGYYQIDRIKVWLLDIVKPDQEFSVAHYKILAERTIADVRRRHKLPIVVGGTGLYIKALIEPIDTIHIPPNTALRRRLKNKTVKELGEILKKQKPDRWKQMNRSDRYNPRRLIRAIEVSYYKKKHKLSKKKRRTKRNTFLIGLTTSRKALYQRIDERVDKRVDQGIIKEIKKLHKKGYTWDLRALHSLGYRQWRPFFEGKSSKEEIIKRWKYDEHAYARRQITWFKKMKNIHWFDIEDPNFVQKAETLVESWYNERSLKLKSQNTNLQLKS